PVLVLDVGNVAPVAPVDGRLPGGGSRRDVGVPVGVALRWLGGHVHAQRPQFLGDESRAFPVIGKRYRIVDRERDDLAALGPAVGFVATVAIPAGLVGPGAAVVLGRGGGSPATVLAAAIDIRTMGSLLGLRRR